MKRRCLILLGPLMILAGYGVAFLLMCYAPALDRWIARLRKTTQ